VGWLSVVLGVLGVALNQVFIWPQVWRARRDVQGVAPLTALGGLLARAAWAAYGLVVADVALVAGNLTVAVGFAALVVLLARAARGHRLWLVLAAAAVVGIPVVLAAVSHWALAVLAVGSAAVVNVPQMLRAMVDRQRLAGVSAATYWLVAAASGCWLLYGLVVRNLVISAPHMLLLPTAVVTAVLAQLGRRKGAEGHR
jgi:uncharacterized protein with PQ loop repeat